MIARLVTVLALALAPGEPPPSETATIDFTEVETRRLLQHSPLPPLPPDPTNRFADDPAAARLGQFLFFDARLSGDGSLSCATCHDPAKGFADALPLPRPIPSGAPRGERHTLSILDAAFARWLFWDGRADSLWAQAVQPIERPLEMGGSRERTARLVAGDPDLSRAYAAVFGESPDPSDPDLVTVRVAKAIAAYERRLVSGKAPFDAFAEGLRAGDPARLAAISPAARRGAKLFVGKADCRSCHSGPHFTDGEFHDTGVSPRDGGPPTDPGRHAGAGLVLADPLNARGPFSDDPQGERARRLAFLARSPATWGQFKTPSLRAAALTAPYMHQGQFATLRDVVTFYSTREGALPPGHHGERLLRPLGLTPDEIAGLVAFVESLAPGPLESGLMKRPPSPCLERE